MVPKVGYLRKVLGIIPLTSQMTAAFGCHLPRLVWIATFAVLDVMGADHGAAGQSVPWG